MKITIHEGEDAIKTFNLISNLTTRNIINFLKENGPSSPSEIAKRINISPSRVSICLQNLRKYNIVTAKWKPVSIDERPLKIYRLVPNILRFEFMINKPKTQYSDDHIIKFAGNSMVEFKNESERGVYVSLNTIPFRFKSEMANILKECTKNPSFGVLAEKFKDQGEEFNKIIKRLLTLGLIEIERPASK